MVADWLFWCRIKRNYEKCGCTRSQILCLNNSTQGDSYQKYLIVYNFILHKKTDFYSICTSKKNRIDYLIYVALFYHLL